ncbi:MAG: hypothetical protein KDD47_22230 [Acidobacteria bacterium]|nr:hypothetical protein [Acidobacteriota bacterium]
MTRFLLLALPALLLLIAGFHAGWDLLGFDNPQTLPAVQLLGLWFLESFGLTTLFLLMRGAGRGRFADGIAAAWAAWVFRGPVVVLTLTSTTTVTAVGFGKGPWWNLALGWLGLYTFAGLVLAALARRSDL